MNSITNLQREISLLKMKQTESVDLLKQLSTQVGTYYGERIAEHIAALSGGKHNAAEWNMADTNGEQGR